MKSALHSWLLGFVATVAVCAVSIAFLDLPVARFFDKHHSDLFESLLHVILIILPVTGWCLIWSGMNFVRKRPVPRPVRTLGIAGAAVFLSLAVNELVLKPLFSRYDVNDYFWNANYGFRLLGGIMSSSFPSGHIVILMSFLSVLWLLSPRGRTVYGTIAALGTLDLVASGWHFISDVVAGGFVGSAIGFMSVTLLRRRTGK